MVRGFPINTDGKNRDRDGLWFVVVGWLAWVCGLLWAAAGGGGIWRGWGRSPFQWQGVRDFLSCGE